MEAVSAQLITSSLCQVRHAIFFTNSLIAKLVSISDSQPIQSRIGTARESVPNSGWSMIACALPMKLYMKSCGCSQSAGGASPETISWSKDAKRRNSIVRKRRSDGYAVAA